GDDDRARGDLRLRSAPAGLAGADRHSSLAPPSVRGRTGVGGLPMPAEESLLTEVPLFQGLDPAERATLSAAMHLRDFPAADRICRRGDPGTALYVIAQGAVEISVDTTTGERVSLARLGH